ncbi:MAG: hypothetical protein IJB16_09150, partial [Clostridia bacterium]|nr:hypothetical protein [Clostridia bacterium]
MKKISMKIVSVILAVSLIFGGSSVMGSAAAADITKTLENFGLSIIETIFTTLVGTLNILVPDSPKFVKVKDRVLENFYEGTEWKEETAENAQWKLGYSKASLVPNDWETKDYYLGGFIDPNNGMVNKVEEIIDDMQVRVIAVEDGSGRGVALFANIDCIGFS